MKLNQIFVIGNLVADAETNTISNGKKKQSFCIAINDDYKDKQTDGWIHRVYFMDCYVIGKEYIGLTKGRSVIINGKLITKNYEVEGQKKKYVAIEVYTLDFMYRKDSSDTETVPAKEKDVKPISEMTEDEVPF